MPLKLIVEFLKNTDELKTAKILLDTFAKYSNSLQQYDELGMLYEKIKDYHGSLGVLEKCIALAIDPNQMKSIRANLSKVYNHLNDPLKSIQYSSINLAMNPEDYEALMEQSFSYYLYGNLEKSYEIQKILLDNPNISEQLKKRITFNMGSFEMAKGDFKTGLYKMIMGGKEIGIWPEVKRPYEKWDGKPTENTILVYAEAGIGDEFINIRFMNELKQRGFSAIWVCFRKETHDIFFDNGFNVVMNTDKLDPTKEYVYCTSMTLPILMDIEKENLWNGPYLTPKKEFIDKWKAILPEKFITVKWAGNPYYDQDLHRTVDIDVLINELSTLDIPLLSIQLDDDKYNKITGIESWDDTIAIQYLATANITSCTSTAHSAGAIGAKCYVLPPICTYYPWLNLKDNKYSYWYGENTKVFTQTKHKDWKLPIGKLKEELINDLEL